MTQPNIREDVAAWNQWRLENPVAVPDLTGANLRGANLTRADLTRANLYGADLTGANLTGANLTRANLTRANLTRANLTRANLTGANGVIDAGITAREYRLVAVQHESDTMLASGCRWFGSASALAYWSMDNTEYVAEHGATVTARMALRVHSLIAEARLAGWTVAAIKELFPSRWLGAADIQGQDYTLVIRRVTIEELKQGSKTDATVKPVVWLAGPAKE